MTKITNIHINVYEPWIMLMKITLLHYSQFRPISELYDQLLICSVSSKR